MKKIAISLVLASLITSNVFALDNSFSDVNNDHPYYAAIESLKNLGIINGYEDGTFQPEKAVNRAEAIKMILGSAGLDIPEIQAGDQQEFPDVPSETWFAKFVVLAKQKGIVRGNDDGTFAPARQVVKAEFLKMLLEAFGKDLSKHQNLTEGVSADTEPGQWFLPYVSYAKTLGIITPTLEDLLYPGKQLNRGECAEMIYKLLVLERGGDAQALLSIAETNLVETLVRLNNNDIEGALKKADSAVFYANETLKVVPDDLVAKGAQKITQGFRSLCLAYQAGVEQNATELKNYVAEAKAFAGEAYNYSESFASLKEKIEAMGDVLLAQISE